MGASQSNQIDPNNERNIELGAASGTADSIELVEASIEKAPVAPALQLATPSASPSRRVLPLALLAHVTCASFVQVCDYASDMLVAYTLISSSPSGSLDRMAGLGILVMAGFSASIAMVLASPIATFMDPSFANFEVFQLRGRMKLVLFLLAPLNLHIAGVGLLYVKAASDGRTQLAGARYALFSQLKMLESGLESLPATIMASIVLVCGEPTLGQTALLASSVGVSLLSLSWGFFMATVGPWKVPGSQRTQLFVGIFLHICWVAAAILALSRAMPQINPFQLNYYPNGTLVPYVVEMVCHAGTAEKHARGHLRNAGAIISNNWCYQPGDGTWCCALGEEGSLQDYNETQGYTYANQTRTFHPSEGAQMIYIPAIMCGFTFLMNLPMIIIGFAGVSFDIPENIPWIKWCETCNKFNPLNWLVTLFIFWLIWGGMVLDSMIGSVVDHFWIMREEERQTKKTPPKWKRRILFYYTRLFPLGRRLLLLSFAIVGLVYSPSAPLGVLLCGLFLADVVASSRVWHLIGHLERDPISMLLSARGVGGGTLDLISVSLLPPPPARFDARRERSVAREAAATGGYLGLVDLLDGLTLLPALSAEQRSLAALADGDVRAALPSLAPAARLSLAAALEAYMPGDPDAASTLEGEMRKCVDGQGWPSILMSPPPPPAPPPPQAMRAVSLGGALDSLLWSGKAGVDGWSLSRAAESADFYVSHSIMDPSNGWFEGRRALSVLRGFLCVHAVGASLIVSAVVLAITLIPLGFAVTNLAPAFPWYAPAVTILVLGLSAVLWLALSAADVLPSTHAPWALSPRTLWLDLCCTPPAASAAPAVSQSWIYLERVLMRSDGLIALVSPHYFTRLRCVFELAVYAKAVPRAELKERVVVLSLEWGRGGGSGSSDHAPPPTDAAFEGLTASEVEMIGGFSCVEAHCDSPAERAYLMNQIRTRWGDEGAFDAFVRGELAVVFAWSKRRFRRQWRAAVVASLDTLLGA